MKRYLLFCFPISVFCFLAIGFSPFVASGQMNSPISIFYAFLGQTQTKNQQKEASSEKTPWRPINQTKKPLAQPEPIPSAESPQAVNKKVTAALAKRGLRPFEKNDPRYGLKFFNFTNRIKEIINAQKGKTGREGPIVVIQPSNRDIQEYNQYSLKIRVKGIADPDIVVFSTDGYGYVRLQSGREPLSAQSNVTTVRGKIWSYGGEKPWEDNFVLSLDLNKDGNQDNPLIIFSKNGRARFAAVDARGNIILISEQEFTKRAQAAAAARPRR